MRKLILAMALIAVAVPVWMPASVSAQDTVIVTASRVERDDYDEYYDNDQSAIGLTRTADFFVKPIYVNSDSRDANVRRTEVDAMLRATIERAQSQGISLVAGRYKLSPLTSDTMGDLLTYSLGNRPDTTRVKLYARLPVGGRFKGQDQVDNTIEEFRKSVPATGRSYIETGSTDLAIDDPDQYRGAVVRAIADESKRYAAMFGGDYGVEIRGLDSELYFKQASQTEVFLFIEHSFVISPK